MYQPTSTTDGKIIVNFNSQLKAMLQSVKKHQLLLIMGNLNEKIDKDGDIAWDHDFGERNQRSLGTTIYDTCDYCAGVRCRIAKARAQFIRWTNLFTAKELSTFKNMNSKGFFLLVCFLLLYEDKTVDGKRNILKKIKALEM